MTIDTVKAYLRVDGNDDNTIISLMMEAAEAFIVSAVGSFDEDNATAKMLYLAAVQDMYDNRQFVAVNSNGLGVSQYYRNMVASIILQLQADELIAETEDSEEDSEESSEENGV